jgi:predicted O-methyltransferase YrrM
VADDAAPTEHHAGDAPIGERSIPAPPVNELALAQLVELAAAENSAVRQARSLAGPDPTLPSPPATALLRWLAASLGARNAVEIGSAAGLSGLSLVAGMGEKGSVTSIEPDPRAAELAQRAFGSVPQGRIRSIPGAASDVLPRLSDSGYDLVVIHRPEGDPEALADHVRRLLRPGGVLLVRSVALDEATAPSAQTRRALVQRLVEDEDVTLVVLPFDTGIALATFGAGDA